MQTINLIACLVVWLGTFWALFTPKVPNCTGGAVVLWGLNLTTLGNIADIKNCHGYSEVLLNDALAFLTLWVIWLIEIHLPSKRRASA